MEGTSGSLFRQQLQPAEIGRKLERAMLAQQRPSVGTILVPNVYEVGLNPRDYAQFADYREGLARQLESWLAHVAAERNLTMVERIRVTIAVDDTARKRNPSIRAAITDGPGARDRQRPARSPQPAQATSVFRIEPPENRRSASLREIDGANRGRTYIVPPGSTSIGRSPDNDIVLDSPDVSRRHARIDCTQAGIRVHDLNSTNGTRLNGDPIRVADVRGHDEIAFGGQRFVIEDHASGHPGSGAR